MGKAVGSPPPRFALDQNLVQTGRDNFVENNPQPVAPCDGAAPVAFAGHNGLGPGVAEGHALVADISQQPGCAAGPARRLAAQAR